MFQHVFGRRKAAGRQRRADALLHCSFCNKSEHDVRKLIAGPTVFICDECVAVCNDILADQNTQRISGPESNSSAVLEPNRPSPSTAPSYPVACLHCGLPVALEEALGIPERGFLCAACTTAVAAALAERDGG